jgi:hypothetical protein
MGAVRQRRPFVLVALGLALLHPGIATARQLGSAGSSATRPAGTDGRRLTPCRGTRPPKRYKHVVWIWFENHSATQVIGSSQAPYMTSLARTCGLATRYQAITHPSLPNYIAATSGGTQGIKGDGPPKEHQTGARSIFDVTRSWKAYAESMPRPCMLKSAGRYAVRHDPSAYYLRLRSTLCRRDVPLGTTHAGALASDLRHRRLPRFSFITPDLCNDMHDCSVGTGDAWLRHWLPLILSSSAYRAGKTAVFVTWDEGEGDGGNRVATIAVAPSVRRGGRTGAALNHYSLLRTTESMLGVRPLLGAAGHARSMRSLLHL